MADDEEPARAEPDGEERKAEELTTPTAIEDTMSPDAPQRSRRRLSFRLGRGGR